MRSPSLAAPPGKVFLPLPSVVRPCDVDPLAAFPRARAADGPAQGVVRLLPCFAQRGHRRLAPVNAEHEALSFKTAPRRAAAPASPVATMQPAKRATRSGPLPASIRDHDFRAELPAWAPR